MDIPILLSAASGCIVFIVLQIIVFRLTNTDHTPRLVIILWITAMVVLGIGDWFFFMHADHAIVYTMLSVVLYTACSSFYLFVVFSGFESSITLRLLREVARAGKKGVLPDALFRTYNISLIVKERLSRFIATGEVRKIGNMYERTEHVSVFHAREYLMKFLQQIFSK